MTDDQWQHQCVLCAARGRTTKLQHGHCCAACADRITADLRAIPELAAMAAASLLPGSGTTGTTHAAYGSRPPLNVDALDPALAHVPGHSAPLLVLLEEWEKLIREMRGMARYGIASAARTVTDSPDATLVGVCGFLAHHVEWTVSEPGFPLEDYADELRQFVRALRRWDRESQDVGTMVRCPTPTLKPCGCDPDDRPYCEDCDTTGEVQGQCGYRLYYTDVHDDVTCRRCGAKRSAMTLAAVAMADGRDVWLDPEAAAQVLGVTEGTLRQWARKGRVQRAHGRYLVRERMGA